MITATVAAIVLALPAQPAETVVARGLTGTITFQHRGAPLRAKLNQGLANAFVVRLNGTDGSYRLDFIGAVAGTFDLREYIEGVDGPLPADVPALIVKVETQLPPNHGTDVFEGNARGFDLEAHYFTALWALGAAWVVVPVVIAVRRMLRKPPPAPVVVQTPAPTLATMPAPSSPGAKGKGGLVWYSPRVMTMSAKFTDAAFMLISTWPLGRAALVVVERVPRGVNTNWDGVPVIVALALLA